MSIELNNHYAYNRTVLANERTLLAYLRTSLTLFVAGVSFIRFFEVRLLAVLGFVFIGISIILVIFGFYGFIKVRKHIDGFEK